MKKYVLILSFLFFSTESKGLPSLKHHRGAHGFIFKCSPWQALTIGTGYYYNWSRSAGIETGLVLRPSYKMDDLDFEDNFTVIGQLKVFYSFCKIGELIFLGIGTGMDIGIKIIDLGLELELDIVPFSWSSVFCRVGLDIPLWKEIGDIYFSVTGGLKLNIF